MEHLYAACALLTTPTHSYFERSWRINFFEREAIQNKSVLNQLDQYNNPPLARILANICDRRACAFEVNVAALTIRDGSKLPHIFAPSLVNCQSLSSMVGAENLDVAAAVFLVSLGASLHYGTSSLQRHFQQYDLHSSYWELMKLLVDVEEVAQKEFVQRDKAAAARLLAGDKYFNEVV